MNFTQGQIVFAVLFAIAFVIGISWAYRKDYQKNKKYFKGTALILISLILIYLIFWMFVRVIGA